MARLLLEPRYFLERAELPFDGWALLAMPAAILVRSHHPTKMCGKLSGAVGAAASTVASPLTRRSTRSISWQLLS